MRTTSLAKTDPAPYYMSYAVSDTDGTAVAASNGSVIFSASGAPAPGGRDDARGLRRARQYAQPKPASGIVSGRCR